MKLEYGLVIVIIAVSLFYGRILLAQYQKTQRSVARQRQKRQEQKGKNKGNKPSQKDQNLDRFVLKPRNTLDIILIIAGGVLIIFGFVMKTNGIAIPNTAEYWWAVIVAGLIVVSLGLH
jgi:FtsH-binding integral membrane protein